MNSITRHREFTGPTPHSVAIIARPTNIKPAEHLILERRRIEDLRERSIAESKYNKQCDLRSAWERTTDKRIIKNSIKREILNYVQRENITLEQRREKLRFMLLEEENQYIEEMEAMGETMEDRQHKMKERAKHLKEKREAERLAYVEEKMEQKFSEECEELRSEISKKTRDKIFKDREEQIRMNKEKIEKEKQMEEFYAGLWEEDTKSKAKHEEMETKQQIERNRSALEILNLQKMAIETQRREEKQIKELEAEWLKEEAALRAYEEEQLKKEKKAKQRAARRARDVSIKLKDRKEAKEKQEQIAMDMKILDKVLQDTENQAVEDINRKKQLREEMQRFMNYVENTRSEEMDREKYVEEKINEEVEKQWRKKDDRKKMERDARKALMQDVLQTREMQIKERAELCRHEQESSLAEQKRIREQMEEHKRLENERLERIRLENQRYQNDLEQQINYEREQKNREIENARKELDALKCAEVIYQKRLRSGIDRADNTKHSLYIRGRNSAINRAKSC